jgi:hypothetical protein
MSQVHILSQDDEKKSVSVIFHIPVPNINSPYGVSLPTAIVTEKGGDKAITSTTAKADELIELQEGKKIELATSVRFSKLGLSDSQKLAEIKAKYVAESDAFITKCKDRLNFFGWEGDVT